MRSDKILDALPNSLLFVYEIHETEEIIGNVIWHEKSFSWCIQLEDWVMSLETLKARYEIK